MERKETFGSILRLLRTKAGFDSQREFARAAGLSQSTLVNLEKGSSKLPNTKTLTRIAAALGLTTEDLLARSEPVVSYTETIYDQIRRDIPIDAERLNSTEEAGIQDFVFMRRNDTDMLKIVSENLKSFRMFRNRIISIRISDEVNAGALCALELMKEGQPSGTFCIRRKVMAERLSNPDPAAAMLVYALDDLRAFELMIDPKNTNYRCVGPVTCYLSPVI